MFGYLIADREKLDEEQFGIYRAAYCGICRKLREGGQVSGTLALSYDLVFLWLVLSSMYEPDEETGTFRCPVHPLAGTGMTVSSMTQYAADVGTILAYHKAMDDWNDDRDVIKFAASKVLSTAFGKAEMRLPRQSSVIRSKLAEITALESGRSGDIDSLCNAFGELLGEVFVCDTSDYWSGHLRRFGEAVGRYLYLLDAVVDLDDDRRKNRYNPLLICERSDEWKADALELMLGEVSELYQFLPIVKYSSIIDSIIYSGMAEKAKKLIGIGISGETDEP